MREEIQDPDGVIAKLKDEVDRLKDKCNRQAQILRSLAPDKYPDVLFICGHIGTKDQNGLPEGLMICPAYGVDWMQIYRKAEQTTGPEW